VSELKLALFPQQRITDDWDRSEMRASLYIPGLAEKSGQTLAKPRPLRDHRVRGRIGLGNPNDWLFFWRIF
jgi:hypothetical protein